MSVESRAIAKMKKKMDKSSAERDYSNVAKIEKSIKKGDTVQQMANNILGGIKEELDDLKITFEKFYDDISEWGEKYLTDEQINGWEGYNLSNRMNTIKSLISSAIANVWQGYDYAGWYLSDMNKSAKKSIKKGNGDCVGLDQMLSGFAAMSDREIDALEAVLSWEGIIGYARYLDEFIEKAIELSTSDADESDFGDVLESEYDSFNKKFKKTFPMKKWNKDVAKSYDINLPNEGTFYCVRVMRFGTPRYDLVGGNPISSENPLNIYGYDTKIEAALKAMEYLEENHDYVDKYDIELLHIDMANYKRWEKSKKQYVNWDTYEAQFVALWYSIYNLCYFLMEEYGDRQYFDKYFPSY